MLVDLGRNDVGRVAREGTVRVDELMSVERYSHVMHIVSHVEGGCAPGRSPWDVLRACFPPGTVCGAPKMRAMEIIDELEPVARGPYAGASATSASTASSTPASPSGPWSCGTAPRTCRPGAGIVADSVPSGSTRSASPRRGRWWPPIERAGADRREAVMLLMIDNYDSFTYNLVQYLGELGADARRLPQRRDHAGRDRGARARRASSSRPGRARPTRRASRSPVIQRFAGAIPILGVCLGHQAIGEAFGGVVVARAGARCTGRRAWIHHDGRGIFAGLPNPFEATRYHSLVVGERVCRRAWRSRPRRPTGEIMGLRHRTLPVEGVQFHPESILTVSGKALLRKLPRPARADGRPDGTGPVRDPCGPVSE